MQGRNQGNYRNPCLTMHQPWASLLIYGIKRVEGRSWPSPIRGRLWIHAASKVPDESTIKAMEQFYREIYAVNGVTDIKFPQHYPVSRLIGCVEVVGCVRGEELSCWDAVPEGVRLEALTDFCWLCEQPKRLVIPFEMRGFQRVYNLEKKIYEAAVRGLTPVESPLPVKFPLPNPRDPFSLKPGSLTLQFSESQMTELEKPPSLSAAITGARAAATQFSSKNQYHSGSYSTRTSTMQSNALQEVETASSNSVEVSDGMTLEDNKKDFCDHYQPSQRKPRRNEWATSTSNASLEVGTASSNLVKVSDDMTLQDNEKGFYEHNQPSQRNPRHNEQATSKIFAEAIRGLKRS